MRLRPTRSLSVMLLASTLLVSFAPSAHAQKKTQKTRESKRLQLDTIHSHVQFIASTALYDIRGEFTDYEVHLSGDPSKPSTLKLTASVVAASVSTSNEDRDTNLRSNDFLSAYKYPRIDFVSSRVLRKQGQLIVEGKLTLRGITRPSRLTFTRVDGEDLKGRKINSYRGKLTIKRSDFDIGKGDTVSRLVIADEVDLRILMVVIDNPAK